MERSERAKLINRFADRIEERIARGLSIGAVVAVTLLVIGLVLMVATGVTPDAAAYPSFEPSRLIGDVLALRPEGFLWAGILVVIATPVLRVVAELIGFAARRDREMALTAAAILVVIAVSVLTALATDG